jgi:myo-inositol-1-phosphate synthase
VAFVNALPVFIASDPRWAAKFAAAGLPIVGDDIKSHVSATSPNASWPSCSRTVVYS